MSTLSPPKLFLLDLACRPIHEAFGNQWNLFLVGSYVDKTATSLSDVDIRLMLDDDEYDKLITSPELRTMLDMAFSGYLANITGLPIDFQIQRMTEANAKHGDKMRNPIGRRTLDNWLGDSA